MDEKTKVTVRNLKREFGSRVEDIPVGGFEIDEDLWGVDSAQIIRFWLATEYDPQTMPMLAAGEVNGREGIWLLGWDNEYSDYPPLLTQIFGQEYADERMAAMEQRRLAIEAALEEQLGLGEMKPVLQVVHYPGRFSFSGAIAFPAGDGQ